MARELTDQQKRERVDSLYAGYKRKFPDVTDITAEELRERLGSENLVLVDVRTAPERAVSTLPGAITPEGVEAARAADPDATFVTYCTMGYRSGLFARELQGRGCRVLNLAGSIVAWTHAGGELACEAGPTRRVHVYGMKWNLAASGYEPIL
jgi:sodium/bile acid cotransporter 7